jgi:hypothetical protein
LVGSVQGGAGGTGDELLLDRVSGRSRGQVN